MPLRYIFSVLAFLSLPSVQAQTTWQLKVGVGSGSIIAYEDDFGWAEIKAFDIVDERIRLGIRPAVGLAFDKPITKACSFGGDFNLLWHSFDYEGRYGGLGGGINVKGKFNLLNAQASGRFTLKAAKWLHFRAGLGAMLRLGDFSDATEEGYGQMGTYTRPAKASTVSTSFLLMPIVGLVYPGKKIGVELLAGHSLAPFDSNFDRFLTPVQLSLLYKLRSKPSPHQRHATLVHRQHTVDKLHFGEPSEHTR